MKDLFKNKTNILGLIFFVVVLVLSIGFTYSYFRTSITGTNGSVSVNSATIDGVTFTAQSITPSSNILPGWSSGAKTLTVEVDDTDYDIPYECTLNVSSNDITDMYLFIDGSATGVQVTSRVMKLTADDAKLTSTNLSDSITYELKFKETGIDQSSQQGKTLSATVTCSLDGVNHLYYSNGMEGVRAFAYDSSGNPVSVSVEIPSNSASLKAAINSNDSSLGLTADQVSGAKIIGLTVSGSGTRTVKIAVNDIASTGETVAVLHYNGTSWEKTGDYVVDSNGEITVVSSSFSPFAFANKGKPTPRNVYDVNDDGVVDTQDIEEIMYAYVGEITYDETTIYKYDLSCDGSVDTIDTLIINSYLSSTNQWAKDAYDCQIQYGQTNFYVPGYTPEDSE